MWSGRQLETFVDGNKTIEFEYDENGLRHRKTVKENGIIIERYDYVWSDGTLISQTYSTYSNGVLDSTNSAKFIYDAWGTLQGFVLNDTATYLYTKNLQGDILSIVNESGQTIVTYEYDSWGTVSFSATSMQNLMLAYTLSFVSPFTYRGYCYDYDIELYYLQSRYYSAEIGRFINTDDTQIAIATQGNVLGANLFAYCENNPVNYIDSSVFSSTKISTSIKDILKEFVSYLTNGKSVKSYGTITKGTYGLYTTKVKYYKSKKNVNEFQVVFGKNKAWKDTADDYYMYKYGVYADHYGGVLIDEMVKLGTAQGEDFNQTVVSSMQVALVVTLIASGVNQSKIRKKMKSIYGNKNNKNQGYYMFQVTKESSLNGWYAYNPTTNKGKKL